MRQCFEPADAERVRRLLLSTSSSLLVLFALFLLLDAG
jgi:hypothetical protein